MPVRRAGGEHGAPQEFWDVVERLFRDRTGHAGLRPLQRLMIEQVFPPSGRLSSGRTDWFGENGRGVSGWGVQPLAARRGIAAWCCAHKGSSSEVRCLCAKCLEVQPAGGSARWRQRSMLCCAAFSLHVLGVVFHPCCARRAHREQALRGCGSQTLPRGSEER